MSKRFPGDEKGSIKNGVLFCSPLKKNRNIKNLKKEKENIVMANLVDYVMELEMDSEIMGQALQVLEENSIDVRMSSKENGYHVNGCCKWGVDSCFFDEQLQD